MKKLLTVLLVSTSLLAASSFADTLYVNGKPVSQKTIDAAMAQFKKSSPMAAAQMKNPQFKKEILQSIGMQQAILLEGNKKGLEKTTAYKEALEQVKPMLYAQILQEQASQGKVTDAEAKAKYAQMVKEAANQKQYDVSHILVKTKAQADKIEQELKGKTGQALKAEFAKLAKQDSIDPGSKAKGGNLGWSDGSNYVPEFTAAIKTLHQGQVSQPIKTQFGYHIIMLDNVKTGNKTALPPFAKIKDQIKQQMQMEKSRAFFDQLKAKYKVEVKG